jgi:hypothetical protein
MDNVDNILKKILLNMRYDSNKTLKENKLLLEEDKQYVLASDGRTLELPLNAVINNTHNHSMFNSKSIIDLEYEFPLWSKSCGTRNPKEYGKCMNDYKIKWISLVKDGSVMTFTIDGKKYVQCYLVHAPNTKFRVLGTPEDMKIKGYSNNCTGGPSQLWTAYSKKPPKSIGVKLVNQECKTKSQTALLKAVIFWKNWLNNPTTRKKVEQNWAYKSNFLPMYFNVFSVDSYAAWNKYFDILNKLNLIFYDETMPNERLTDLAYVKPDLSLYDIHVNCSQNNEDFLDTMVHEIQHLLYHVKPLNPAKKISDAFVNKNEEIETVDSIFNINNLLAPINTKTLDVTNSINNTSKKLNIPYETLEWWKIKSIQKANEDPSYICSEDEKMSNIMGIRSFLGITAGFFGFIDSDGITLNMLMPYIKLEKSQTNIIWLLLCWAHRNFPDINEMLDEINALAVNQGDEPPKIGDLPKPNLS